ncbi:KilA-N domain-containing protein [Microscilla marina]|uniref:KilA-N domain superfamily n=1 Tax=Microscilla marina ATCC 23134 TaxID=313606 RepID=A1ZLU3_MICM2|nr:KilA-N domain-containing protein [Microscilla marina]EAY28847.1 KilA-N domain superfamily [Microscilla marina ATCC 23134]
MNNQLQKTYLGKELIFTSDGWINATQTAKAFDKDIRLYTRSKQFTEYVAAMCEYYGKDEDDFIKTMKGNFTDMQKLHTDNESDVQKLHITQGTYFHPFLAVPFARWINPRFAVWCDDVMRQILTGELELRYKDLRQDYGKLEEKHDKLFEELRLYQRPEEHKDTPKL